MAQVSLLNRVSDGDCLDAKKFVQTVICATETTTTEPWALLVAGAMAKVANIQDKSMASAQLEKFRVGALPSPSLVPVEGSQSFEILEYKETSFNYTLAAAIPAAATGTTVTVTVALTEPVTNINVGQILFLNDVLTGTVENVIVTAVNTATNEVTFVRNSEADATQVLPAYVIGQKVQLGLKTAQLFDADCSSTGCEFAYEQPCCKKYYLAFAKTCVSISNDMCFASSGTLWTESERNDFIRSEILRKQWEQLQNTLMNSMGALRAGASGNCATQDIMGFAYWVKEFTPVIVSACCVENLIDLAKTVAKIGRKRKGVNGETKSRTALMIASSQAYSSFTAFTSPQLNMTTMVNLGASVFERNGFDYYMKVFDNPQVVSFSGINMIIVESDWMTENMPGQAAVVWTDSIRVAYMPVKVNNLYGALGGNGRKLAGGLMRTLEVAPSRAEQSSDCVSAIETEYHFQVFMNCPADNLIVTFPECEICPSV